MKPQTGLSDAQSEMDDLRLGGEIRALRKQRQMSTAALAEASGVSSGMISQIERGVSSPSLRILDRLARSLGLGLTALIERAQGSALAPAASDPVTASQEAQIIRRSRDRPSIFGRNSIFYKEILTPAGSGTLQLLLIVLPPQSACDAMQLGTGEKAGIVLDGVLTLEVDGVAHELSAGDSFRFAAALPHLIVNRGTSVAKLHWVMALFPPVQG